jgi:hypothetical protein
MFNSILVSGLTITNFIVCISVSIVLGLIVAMVHMLTVRSNKNFIQTLCILPVLVTMVILLVNGNLGTGVAVAGAFSLVRFRSIPGNSREIMAVFFAMAIGLSVGTGYIAFGALFTVFVSLFLFIISKINFGELKNGEKKLVILIPEDLDYTNVFDNVFDNYLDRFSLIKSKTTNMGSLFELTYMVKLKSDINEKEFIDKIRVKNGNLKVLLSHPLDESEAL